MWYTHAYNQVKGIGGGILPPPKHTNNKIATPPEVEQIKEEIDRKSEMPVPPEKQSLNQKLEDWRNNGKWSNGHPPIPATTLQGHYKPVAIEDPDIETENIVRQDDVGQGYERQKIAS